MVLILLADNPGLNTKQVYHHILRQGGRAISYQAVHKKIGKMIEEGVISKTNHTFTISENWLNEVESLVETAKHKAMNRDPIITEQMPIQEIRAYYDTKYKDKQTKEPFY